MILQSIDYGWGLGLDRTVAITYSRPAYHPARKPRRHVTRKRQVRERVLTNRRWRAHPRHLSAVRYKLLLAFEHFLLGKRSFR